MISKWLRLCAFVVIAVVSATTMYRTLFPEHKDLTVMCSNDSRVCEEWKQRAKRDLGLNIQYVSLPTQEALKRMTATAATAEFDVWVGGPSENYRYAASQGLFQSVELPNAATIPDAFKDPHHLWVGVYASLLSLCSNPEVLAKAQLAAPQSWRELQDEVWSQRISAPSPLSSGTGYAMLLSLDAAEFTPSDITQVLGNVGRFTRSGNSPSDVVAYGEAAVAVSYEPYCQGKKTRKGTELIVTYPQEGTTFEIAGGAIMKGSANADNARAFMDWLISPAGQEAAADVGLPQVPVNTTSARNISVKLHNSQLLLLTIDPVDAERRREQWMTWFAEVERQ